jgi:transketolase
MHDLKRISREIRGRLCQISHQARTPHLGSSLSCTDIVTAAYWNVLNIDPGQPDAPDRDRLLFSKGHAATTLYIALEMRGFTPPEYLKRYAQPGGELPEHPSPGCAPGIEITSGSLGHGLSMGIGMALAARIQQQEFRVYVLMSDGECNEGSVWEAALMAPARGLDNLVAIVDFNKWQATDRSEEVMSLTPFREKWEAFGWSAYDVDGHDMDALCEVMNRVPDGSGKPVAIVAHTVKGKGISFMEDDNNWHYRIPNEDEFHAACAELGLDPADIHGENQHA